MAANINGSLSESWCYTHSVYDKIKTNIVSIIEESDDIIRRFRNFEVLTKKDVGQISRIQKTINVCLSLIDLDTQEDRAVECLKDKACLEKKHEALRMIAIVESGVLMYLCD